MGWCISAGIMRLVRSSMLEVLDAEFVKLARVKGLAERAVHPLRPAYTTHRREAGVKPRLSQRVLGHPQRATTLVDLHLTHTGHAEAYARLNARMQGLLP